MRILVGTNVCFERNVFSRKSLMYNKYRETDDPRPLADRHRVNRSNVSAEHSHSVALQ